MIKIIGFTKKKEGLTIDEFSSYWQEKHAPLGFEILPDDIKITRYVHHYTVPMEGLGEPAFDGVAEFGFDNLEMFQKWLVWFMGDGGQPLRDDEMNFMDSASALVVMVEERVIIPADEGRPDGIKLIAGVKRKSGLTLEDFKNYWHDKHAPLALKILPKAPNVQGYVHNYALAMEGLGEPALDGIGEIWFKDLDAFFESTAWFMGDGCQPLRDDEENFVDASTRVAVIVKERTFIR